MPPLCLIFMYWPLQEYLEHEWDSPERNDRYLPTHKRVIGPFLFDENIITVRSFLYTLENHALQQPSSNNNMNNLIFQLSSAPVHLGYAVHVCLNVNFPGWWIRRVGPILLPPLFSRSFAFGLLSTSCLKVQVYSRRVNVLDELKSQITASIPHVTMYMLQNVWQDVNCRWTSAEE